MNAADWSIVIIVAASITLGLIRGFAREAIALGAWLLGLWLAWTFSDVLQPHLGGLLAEPVVNLWSARLLILFAVLLIGGVVGVVMGHFIHATPFGFVDRGLGLVFGLLRGLVVVGLLVIGGQLVKLDGERWWSESKLLPYAEIPAGWVNGLVGRNKDPADSSETETSTVN